MSTTGEQVQVTPELLAEIEAKAAAASPGPWEACIGSARRSSWMDLAAGGQGPAPDGESCKCRMVYGNGGPPVVYALAAEDEMFTCGEGATKEQARANARYIGAVNPAVMLALVQRIRELEDEIADMFEAADVPDPLSQALNEGDGAYRP